MIMAVYVVNICFEIGSSYGIGGPDMVLWYNGKGKSVTYSVGEWSRLEVYRTGGALNGICRKDVQLGSLGLPKTPGQDNHRVTDAAGPGVRKC